MISQWKEVFIKMGSLLIITTNSFRIPVVQKNWKHFHLYFFFCIGMYSLFRSNNKIHDDKRRPKQVNSFHAHADIKQCLHISKVHLEMKAFMNKSKKTAPNWSFGGHWQVLWILSDLRWSDIYLWRSCNSWNAPIMDQ